MMILWGALAVIAVVVVWRTLVATGGWPSRKTASRTPEDVLEERYARGEIDAAELERRRSALRG
jgi:putative membrane protein